MNSQSKTENTTEALKSITDQRLALESLIKIACGVQGQHQALTELALSARPSQEFPRKTIRNYETIEASVKDTSDQALLDKLDVVEKAITKALDQILQLSNLSVTQLRTPSPLRNNEIMYIDTESFKRIIGDFENRTQTSLALRYILKNRGVTLAPLKLAVPQESIGAQIEQLKDKERWCVKQIRTEIQEIIKDSQTLLLLKGLDPGIQKELLDVQKAMQVNLDHLDQGGSVTEIPNVFEIITLKSDDDLVQPDQTITENKPADAIANDIKASPQASKEASEPQAETRSFWQRLKLWLSTPWSTSWRSLKRKNNDK